MDALQLSNLILLALFSLVALVIGYMFGSRTSRRQKRELQRELNQTNMAMLDVKSQHTKLTKFLGQSNRKDRLLKLTLKQLTEANQRANLLQQRMTRDEKQHYIKTSRLRLFATQTSEKARRATLIANRANNQLTLLKKTHPSTQTINAPPPKSYGQAAAVPVTVVDQQTADAQQQAITRVSNRDSARFTRLRSSNEGRRFNSANLQAIEGINPLVEKKLNQMGIHRVEQLANISDSDLEALNAAVGGLIEGQNNANYTATWKGGAQQLLKQS